MIYLDTSFIAPLIISEASSRRVETIVLKTRPGELTTSHWSKVELAGLIARQLFLGELSASDAAAVKAEFEQILAESFHVILPTAADYNAARDYLDIPNTRLRAGDALHLAIAANHGARKIWSLDQGFIQAGKRFNLPVSAG